MLYNAAQRTDLNRVPEFEPCQEEDAMLFDVEAVSQCTSLSRHCLPPARGLIMLDHQIPVMLYRHQQNTTTAATECIVTVMIAVCFVPKSANLLDHRAAANPP